MNCMRVKGSEFKDSMLCFAAVSCSGALNG